MIDYQTAHRVVYRAVHRAVETTTRRRCVRLAKREWWVALRSTHPTICGAGLAVLTALAVTSGCASSRITADPVYFPSPPAAPHAVHIKSFNSLHDLVPHRVSLVELIRGQALSPHVTAPRGIAYHAGHLYICDAEKGVVHDWDLDSGAARQIGIDGDVALSEPVAVAVDDGGTLYVADTDRAEVVAYSPTSQVLHRMKPPDRDDYRPVAVAVHESKVYVADMASHRVDVFSVEDGRYIDSLGEVGSELGRFYYPAGVAVDADGNIFVSDMFNARVQMFDASHKAVSSMGQPGDRYGDMSKPRHLSVGPDGVIFITDTDFAHVHLFNKQGQLLMLLGGPEHAAGGTPMPFGVSIAKTVPEQIASLVPADFAAHYYLFTTSTIGPKRISLFAIGEGR